MKLFITPNSPYARMVRVVVREKGLQNVVEELPAQTRQADSPYYQVNPSGRVPYLVLDDGRGLEDSALICSYLDQLDGTPRFHPPTDDSRWECLRLDALGRSLMDGLSVWGRELKRPGNERSPTVIDHEIARSGRLVDALEREVENQFMHGEFNLPQMSIITALQLDHWNPRFVWRDRAPRLAAWAEPLSRRPSLAETIAPSAI